MGLRWVKTQYPGVRMRVNDEKDRQDPYYTIRYKHQGKLTEEKLGRASEGWTARKAAAQLARIREALTTGVGPQSLAESRALRTRAAQAQAREASRDRVARIAFCEVALDWYMPHAKRTKRSWDDDLSRLECHVLPALGNLPLRDVRKEDVETMLDAASRKVAPATTHQCLALTRRIYNFSLNLTIHGAPAFSGRNPCDNVVVRRADNARLRFLTREETERLIEAAQGFGHGLAMHDMIVLSLNTGMRLGEIQRLRRPDVDMAHGIIHILDRKGKPGGVAYVNDRSRYVLERRLVDVGPGGLVFTPPCGGRVRENISQGFKELADRIGLNDGVEDPRQRVVFHTLRHTFASWLAIAGTDIYQIKDLMRHKTITMTMRYSRIRSGRLVRRMNSCWGHIAITANTRSRKSYGTAG